MSQIAFFASALYFQGFVTRGCSRAGAEFDPGNVIQLGLSSFTASSGLGIIAWSRTSQAPGTRQLAADETNILITLLLGHSSSSQGTHAVSHFNTGTSLADPNSPAWVIGSVAAIVVITQDYLTLDQKLLNVQRLSEHMQLFNLKSIHESILILLYFPNPPCLLSSQFQSLDVKIPAKIISNSSQCPIFSLVALLTTNHPTQDSFWPTICLLFNCGQMIVPATVLLHPTILSIINCHSALFTRWQRLGRGTWT